MKATTQVAISLTLGLALVSGQANGQTTVFSADFENTDLSSFDNDTNPVFDVNVGSISFAKGAIIDIPGDPNDGERVGRPQLYDLNDPVDVGRGGTGGFLDGHTDWGDQSLAVERNSDKTQNADESPLTGAHMEWIFTDPVELDGAQVDFEFYMIRAGTGPAKNQTITGYDSSGRELFSLLMISRNTYPYADFPDYDNIGGSIGNERQDKTIGYIDPATGDDLLFATAQIASGAIPDTNPGDSGTSDQVGLYGSSPATISGNTNPNNFFEIDDTALFSVSLTDTGWTLDVEAAPTPDNDTTGLSDFTTVEFEFSDSEATDLASVEVVVSTDQGGGWWDNLLVTGTAISDGLAGDFNNNGSVDAADYAVWLQNLGRTEDGSALNGNGNGGLVDLTDYELWKSSLSNTSAVQTATAVPEPSGALLVLTMTVLSAGIRNSMSKR